MIFALIIAWLATPVIWAYALPKIFDAFLYYFDKRVQQLNKEAAIQKRKLEIMQAQYTEQERRR